MLGNTRLAQGLLCSIFFSFIFINKQKKIYVSASNGMLLTPIRSQYYGDYLAPIKLPH